MTTFIMIYGLIFGMGIISALIDKTVLKKKQNFLSTSLMYSIIYYVTIAFGRAVVGSGDNYLSYSFYGKEARGYIKVLLLVTVAYIINSVLRKYVKESYEKWLMAVVGIYSAIAALYIVFWDQLALNTSCILFGVAVCAALVSFKKASIENESSFRQRCILLLVLLGLFSVMHYIVGPAELYAYNKEDFIYSYIELAPHLWSGAFVFTISFSFLIGRFAPELLYKLTCLILAAYNVIGYIQFFFLNGKMSSLDGSEQKWEISKLVINLIMWVVILSILAVLSVKYKKSRKFIIGVSIYIILIQTVSYVYLLMTMDITHKNDMQVVEDGVLELAHENIIVFILDAYDTQEIQMVLNDDPNYLKMLHDFTYFNNMNSRYYYTDYSLPYLLTGGNINELDIDDKSGTYSWYDDDCFLRDIDSYGYDIRVLTEKKYVDKFPENNVVKNYSKKAYCILDTEKTLASFAKAIRFRNMPFCLKGFYRYGIFDFEDVVADTNIYKMGTDDKFDDMVNKQGLRDYGDEKAYRFYHLYGAHAPYYMTEDARMDYSSCNPLAQFKGSLKVVYDYLDELKKADLYNESTIIITADHGLNPGQVDALRDAGISCDDSRSNPIFFIKLKAEQHEELEINSRSVSHDQFFDTIMTCIDSEWKKKYNGTIWE